MGRKGLGVAIMAEKVYLDDNGNPIGTAKPKVYLDDNGEPMSSLQSISPTLMQSRRDASKSEFESNRPESTLSSRMREASIGLLEPFTAQSFLGGAKATGNALWDAVSGNGTGKAKDLLTSAVKAPLQPIKNLAEGIKEQDWDKAANAAGGFASQTVPAIEGLRTMAAPVYKPLAGLGAERLYESALKPGPRSNTLADVRGMVRTGLDEGIPVSAGGVRKLGETQSRLSADVANSIASTPAPPINKFKVASRLTDSVQKFANQVNPEADLGALSDVGNEFIRNAPNDIPTTLAQDMKQGTYRQLKDSSFGEMRRATVEGQKSLARGLKEELEARYPDIKGMNERNGRLFKLQPELESAVNRNANRNMLGFATPIIGLGTEMMTGSAPAAIAATAAKELMTPAVKSRLAIALSRVAK